MFKIKYLFSYILYTIFWNLRKNFLLQRDLSGKDINKVDAAILYIHNLRSLKKIAFDPNYDPSKKWIGASGNNFWSIQDHNINDEDYYSDNTYRTPFLKGIVNYLQKEEINNVIEIGCGTGSNIAYLQRHVTKKNEIKYYGIDINSEIIEKASNKYPSVKFVEADAINFFDYQKLDKNSFIFTCSVLMYFNSFNITNLLEKIPSQAFFGINEPYTDTITDQNDGMIHSLNSFFHDYEKIFIKSGFKLVEKNIRNTHNSVKIISLIYIKK